MPTFPPLDYASLAAMPTTPKALRAWIYKNGGGLAVGDPAERASFVYTTLSAILRYNVLPPRTEATVFRTLRRCPA